MKPRLYCACALTLLAGTFSALNAAIPPAAKLLPPDTLAVLAVPDFAQYRTAVAMGSGQLWSDPALRPFLEKLQAKFREEVLDKLEREAGIKLAEFAELLQGQLTLAITRNGWQGSTNPLPALVIVLDTRDKEEQLKARLGELRKKIAEAGLSLKAEVLRDVEFTTLRLAADDPGAPRLTFGQVGSVLVLGTAPRALERVVAGLQGGGLPTLAEESAFAEDYQRFFRDAVVYGWINARPLVEVATQLATAAAGAGGNNPMAPQPGKLIEALGLKALKTLAFGVRISVEGTFVDLNVTAPRQERKGLLQLLATEPKDASIPGFVPVDTVGFWRWRLDGQRFWATIEATLEEIAPGTLGFLTAQLDEALKQKDPNLNFRRSFLMNLGDDLISYQKAPRGTAAADLLAQPSLTLIGSPNPGQLLGALRSAISLLPGPLASMEFKDREFLGQRIYSLTVPDVTGGGKPTELHFVASGGYLAISADTVILEEYLRRADARPKPLAEFPGLREAAEKVGGTGTGLFSFQNDVESLRMPWEALRQNKNLFLDLVTAQNPALKEAMSGQDDFQKKLSEWLDFSLLPPFERVARYFHFTVFAGQASNAGYLLKIFTPFPPGLR